MILNLYKPVSWSSFDVVKKIRGITKEKKVGHGGTLDPFAEGVIIIGTGSDTKRLTTITNEDKSYKATLYLGETTDTLDPEGTMIDSQTVPNLTDDEIKNVLHSFLSTSFQEPPMYSAKKINGQRLYKLARKNIEVKRDLIKIHIKDIQLLGYSNPSIHFSVTCSKGTYVRVLGKDIAANLGTVGYLTSLVRTQVGDFSIDDSQLIDEFEITWKSLET
ncbi:MAG: tRNA pseudouridine(55) synthase TruB [Candidatus Neomarinimicrobiota bacterium]|nr:tRNA pseudouridine(55) synthase TruB [Candidatus Neomarinimicrobiota bacterium]